ncbi:Smr/MutS family protein [Carnimonas bestiolae]|uniref:Smr/MutS family protein n=1 Tax=Carnimonas bestiolae TaxID=3402172 RepID=UPI003EDC7B5E
MAKDDSAPPHSHATHNDNDRDDDEVSLFRQALHDAGVERISKRHRNRAELKRNTASLDNSAATARRRAAEINEQQLHARSRTSDGRVEPVSPSQSLLFALGDIDQRLIGRLKRGEIEWQAGLDLHGYTLEEARHQVEEFLHDADAKRLRCVLIVHGKAWSAQAGYPIIKSHVNAWLREWPQVLAFSSATSSDGGTGAVYVLLKKAR